MLSDEHRMASKGRLFSIVRRVRSAEARGDEIARVVEHRGESLRSEVFSLARSQMKAATKVGCGKPGEDVVERIHSTVQETGQRSAL